MDFIGEVVSAIRVADGAVIVLDAVGGVEVERSPFGDMRTSASWRALIFVNKMDRENASYEGVISQLREVFSGNIVPLQLPVMAESNFRGVVDLISQKAIGPSAEEAEVPGEMAEAVDEARTQLIEASAEGDDELIMKYLEGEELSPDEIRRGLKAGVLSGDVIPVLCGTSTNQGGIQPLMNAIVKLPPIAG